MMLSDVTDAAQLLFSIFISDLFPVFAIAGAGFLLARTLGVQVQTVSRVTFYALAPALVFNVLVSSTLDGLQAGRMVLFYVLVTIAAGLMARLAAIPLRLDRPSLSAFLLVVVSSNSGNYGLPVAMLAFGRDGLAFASMYFLASSLFSYTGGILIAATGRRTIREAIVGITRVPAVYGAAAAGLSLLLHWPLPDALMRPVSMLSDAALPMMIIVLGMQLERATRPDRPAMVATAVVLSIVLMPLAAIGIAHLVGLHGAAFQAGVLQASMPTAVITTILALEFNVEPNFVTSVVALSTLLSPLTVTVLIAFLQRHA
ncbi:MAG TPA: AEC family transporter [Vicinamibacterales bacterium]|nr:AEC family transporter [Vicinamibacterales bacterium]